MDFVISDAERSQGVVYLNEAQKSVASTHALVIGVGQYTSQQLAPVASPTVAARMIADWFVDGMDDVKPGGFANADKPLGSLSVLLSEFSEGTRSRFADADVPRATFDNVRKAVEAWIDRASSNPDNFLFLFIASHGESFGRRTAFLLEDYGTNKHDVTAGMSEIEQFVEALANVDAKQQLLIFDCCRLPTTLGLRFDQEFGNRLVNLPAATDGRMRRAYVLRSTGLGFEAWGRKDGPTLFAQALLDALRGLAASSGDNWTVDNFGVARTVARLLGLHKRNGETLQMPESQLNAPFVISAVPEIETATVFVSLGPQHDFSTCNILLDDKPVERAGNTPFARLELPKFLARKIAAHDAAGQLIGEARIEPLPPVAFRELPETVKISRVPGSKGFFKAPTRVFKTMLGRGIDVVDPAKGQISLSLGAVGGGPYSGLMAVIKLSATQAFNASVALTAGGKGSVLNVLPGRYDVSVELPDGRCLLATVEVDARVTVEVNLQVPAEAFHPNVSDLAAATVGDTRVVLDRRETAHEHQKEWLRSVGAHDHQIVTSLSPGLDMFAAPIPPGSARFSAGSTKAVSQVEGSIDSELLKLVAQSPGVFGIEDRVGRRFPQRHDSTNVAIEQADLPVWVAATGDCWREIAAFPSLGAKGKFQKNAAGERENWTPTLVVDSMSRASHVGATINPCQWASLFAFLARRDFELSGAILKGLVGTRGIRTALLEKIENPIAAMAGALVAVATRRLVDLQISEQWLRNLVNWFPMIPDGPVILARHLMSSGNDGNARSEAKMLLLLACDRGVPLFSLSVDWLAEALADFSADQETASAGKATRRLAQLCDPSRIFTVLQVPIGEA